MHYKVPKPYSKASSGDYVKPPPLNTYDIPNLPNSSYQYETPSSLQDSTVVETLPDDEHIYEDPGHKKEKIYAWFEKKKYRIIEGNDIQ